MLISLDHQEIHKEGRRSTDWTANLLALSERFPRYFLEEWVHTSALLWLGSGVDIRIHRGMMTSELYPVLDIWAKGVFLSSQRMRPGILLGKGLNYRCPVGGVSCCSFPFRVKMYL
ncbi:hypothetical protein CEXT_255691 [Caerostris extrusa]|uniref:HNH nuclease domain-containing protein n=1 Tax=Caerostris extrusa TaxID=172846 RepID=A0AAV4XFR7_CAEEX|nr:hypothetical protein CEXT_255691 [Caerostris extrusa]